MLRRQNNTRKWRLFVIFLHLVSTICSENRNDVPTFPTGLSSLCPYTSFCKGNSTQIFESSKQGEPCCQPCSCESTCGLQYNCCFKHLDLYNIEETYQMVCKSVTATKSLIGERTHRHYRMINKCIYSRESSKVKTQPVTDTSTFHPVYSEKTGYIYFNSAVAVCNNAINTVPFRKAFTCPSQEDLLTDADRLVQGLEPYSECYMQYIPPDGVNLKNEQCEPNVVRKCNVTGEMEERTPFWDLCETFNATYIRQIGLMSYGYGNIYCHMCNKWMYDKKRQDVCKTRETFGNNKVPGKKSLTVILEHGLKSHEENANRYTRTSNSCPVNEIMVKSFSKSCRPVKCPFLKVLLNTECKFYSKRLIGGPFSIYLRLVPLLENANISRSYFDKMPENDKNDKTAKWLKRKAMKRWNIYTYYHLFPDNVNIEYFVVKAIYPVISVNPKYIEKTVDMALKELWLITQLDRSTALRAHFNEYTSYSHPISRQELMEEAGIDVKEDIVYIPGRFQINIVPIKTLIDEILLLVPKYTWEHLQSEMIHITKLFLCKQVDLLPEEYEDGPVSIFFKVRNITLYTFIRVFTTSKVSHLDNLTAEGETVRICLNEFPQAADVANKEYTFEVKIIALFTTINLIVKMM